jgi:acyl dehydratase
MAERTLQSSPSMAGNFARAGVAAVPGASLLPFVGGRGAGLPELTLTLEDVEIDRDRLAAYDRVCGFGLSDELPATYPHMLAFPLQLSLMTDSSFPFGAIGLVHITNRIVQHRALVAGERLSLRVWADDLRPHPRGQQFSLRTEVTAGGELVWEETSTNLRRGSGGTGGDPEQADPIPSAKGLEASATWSLPGDLGRRYAGVSGDYNPIHVHPLSARLFGFPRAIAHGMWTQARCLAALASRLPDAYTVEAAFRKPILLPGKVEFASGGGDAGILYGVRDARKGTPHLDGRIRF